MRISGDGEEAEGREQDTSEKHQHPVGGVKKIRINASQEVRRTQEQGQGMWIEDAADGLEDQDGWGDHSKTKQGPQVKVIVENTSAIWASGDALIGVIPCNSEIK